MLSTLRTVGSHPKKMKHKCRKHGTNKLVWGCQGKSECKGFPKRGEDGGRGRIQIRLHRQGAIWARPGNLRIFQVRKGRIPGRDDNLSLEYVKSEFYQSLKKQIIPSVCNFSEEAQKKEEDQFYEGSSTRTYCHRSVSFLEHRQKNRK